MIKLILNPDGSKHVEASFTQSEMDALYGMRTKGNRRKRKHMPEIKFGIK